jgi:hypothetical protein
MLVGQLDHNDLFVEKLGIWYYIEGSACHV